MARHVPLSSHHLYFPTDQTPNRESEVRHRETELVCGLTAHTADRTFRATSPGRKADFRAFAQCLTVRNRFCGPTLSYKSHPTDPYLVALISVTTRKTKFSCLCGSRWLSLSKYMKQVDFATTEDILWTHIHSREILSALFRAVDMCRVR